MSALEASATPGEPVIEARGLVRHFGRFVAVDDVDVTVAAGEVFGLLGANGAGKTTIIRMLCGLLPPTAGDIRVAGIDMVRHARRARARIGYVAQRFALYGELSVRENLVLQAGLFGLHGKRRGERLERVLERMTLTGRVDIPTGRLPLGYQRRLSLGAALLHEPDVLFLDEPTSGVDPEARQRFWELIYELAEAGIGILVTTHYMDEAEFCDRLALMHAGRIVEEGSPSELVQRPDASPMLRVHSRDSQACTRALEAWSEVREAVPHAGWLRVRLGVGTDAAALCARIEEAAARGELPVDRVEQVAPELEEVFVTVLERSAGVSP
ncbi:MAG: ABC transporter ATP-binding protein [Gammaproteobacteria bacterium]|nr:ABC transporter ATP-binding protein [Gammaproteobacteria bacterium]NIR83430.1 ABC transporter ATP-binding protein [Gammaproteobacteria bacterium]NIR91352.1 ABC transporter ATP-binding protein [Gammaproteobacteria bacterium]NIU04592.1 ABC transporter ATP-binding protein [Gammaproteobacteria bacterium]NIV51634.1 ATP-binding cassette domain-containing protein [Gammaproteobacteria bacterium]